MIGGNGDDWLLGGFHNDWLYGGNGRDRLQGDEGVDRLFGGAGIDTLDGYSGDDILYGGGDNDLLNGGEGNDRRSGGGLADRFVFDGNFGNDTITDFDEFNDAEFIDLRFLATITDYNDLLNNHMNQVGADVLIDDGLGNTITVLNALIGNMNEADFTF